ncbi:MAG: hypothetical protein ACKOBZ_05105 [Nitrospira sp.]
MLKIIGAIVLLGGVFALGYYSGSRPAAVKKAVKEISSEVVATTKELSRTAINTSQSLERTLRYRQGVVDAKEKLLEARTDLNEKNFGDAAKELTGAVTHLEEAALAGDEGTAAKTRALAATITGIERELAKGNAVDKGTLAGVQKELDTLLDR